jgi:SAM-dependent methyltransferase
MLGRLVSALRWRVDRLFDLLHRVDTTGITRLQALDIAGDNVERGVFYEPTPERYFSHALAALRLDCTQFRFVDLGSGKGRVLLMAAKWPFAEVIGVEFSHELHEQAERKIEATRRRRHAGCGPVRSVCADAVDYRPPASDLVVYMFNPFDAVVMAQVLPNLQQAGRRLVIIYCQARCHQTIVDSGIVRWQFDVPLPRIVSRGRGWISSMKVYANFDLPRA